MRNAVHRRLARLEARRRPVACPVDRRERDARVAAVLANPEWAEQICAKLIGQPGYAPRAVADGAAIEFDEAEGQSPMTEAGWQELFCREPETR